MMPFSETIKNVSIIAKKLKDGYIDAFIGFPLTSLDKYIPNDGSVTFVPISDLQITRITDIINHVLAFPLEDRSPMDAYNFLRDLRRDIVAIF